MFKNEAGEGVKGRLNTVQKTDNLVREGVPYRYKLEPSNVKFDSSTVSVSVKCVANVSVI